MNRLDHSFVYGIVHVKQLMAMVWKKKKRDIVVYLVDFKYTKCALEYLITALTVTIQRRIEHVPVELSTSPKLYNDVTL